MTKVVQVTSYNELSKLLSAAQDSITIIEFYDTSNGICNLLSPRIQSKINCSGVKIKLVRVDVLICPELHVHYKISKLPTVIGLRGSQVVTKLEDSVSDRQLDELIDLLIKRFCC